MSVHSTTIGLVSRWCAALAIALVVSIAIARADQAGIAQPALNLVNELTAAARAAFFVYKDSDSGLNHSFPSGWFPAGAVLSKIHLDTACVYDPASSNGCTLDPNRLDRVRGTVIRVTFDPLSSNEFVGINFEEPENFGVNPRGVGYDLQGATQVCFDALSPTPPVANFKVQFSVAQHAAAFSSIPAQWTPMCFPFALFGLTSTDLSQVHFPFTVGSNAMNAPAGGTVLLDNIRFEPVPSSQATATSFPLANEFFGVLPASTVQPGRVKIPPDQVLPNLTTLYESTMAVLTLLSTGDVQDANSARQIADALVSALGHDNQGLPIPAAPDGSTGLHNGMFDGDLMLFNDQGPGAGRKGQVRLSGFSIASSLCGPSHFCLVLDGATGGNNAFVILALSAAYQKFHDQRYLDAAFTIGRWIHGSLLDTTGTGYGGYYLGYPDEGQAKQLLTGKSIENNADIFRAFSTLATILRGLGLTADADVWNARARVAGDFVIAMFDPIAGRFYAGTVPSFVAPSPGIAPNGPQRGDDVINTFDFLDAQTFTLLPLASSPFYRHVIDWRRPVQWMVDHFAQVVTAGGQQFQGFNLVATSTEGPSGVAWEFTGQAVVAMRFVDALYGESHFEAQAQLYLAQIAKAQQLAPFTDLRGLVAATAQDGDLLPPYEQCLSTPFQCIAERVGLAATTWAILAERNVNPFMVTDDGPIHGAPIDYDGDGRSEIALYRPSVGGWLLLKSSTSYVSNDMYSWGLSSDKPVSADYDGDGRSDLAVYRPSTGQWYILQSSSGYASYIVVSWGNSTDVPVPGDYDGDGKADVAIFRPSTGQWYILKSSSGFTAYMIPSWGLGTDVPVPADYDGDGTMDIAVFRPSTGQWYILKSSSGFTAYMLRSWGLATDVPVPADYDGDGQIDIAVFRPSTGQWYILKSSSGFTAYMVLSWGLGTDVPVPSDYDGDGKADIAVFRPSTSQWYILNSGTNYTTHGTYVWGLSSDVPLLRRP